VSAIFTQYFPKQVVHNFFPVFTQHKVKSQSQDICGTGIVGVFKGSLVEKFFVEGGLHLYGRFGISFGIRILAQQTGKLFHKFKFIIEIGSPDKIRPGNPLRIT